MHALIHMFQVPPACRCHYATKRQLSKEQRAKLEDGPDFEDFVHREADSNGYQGDLKLEKGMKRYSMVHLDLSRCPLLHKSLQPPP